MRDGPMLSVYFPGSGPGALTCTHKNFEPLIRRIAELKGVIMQHTWNKAGGKQGPGESTPTELATVAARSRSRNLSAPPPAAKKQILGQNYRDLLKPILKRRVIE